MSRIYFHALDEDDAEVRGAERHYAAAVMRDVCRAVIPGGRVFRTKQEHPIARYLSADWQPFPGEDYVDAILRELDGTLRASSVAVRGQNFAGFDILANTALRLGSDAVKLLARMHASCEVHTWVDGPNRAWLADIIERGRQANILRSDMGWEAVVTLLRAASDAPIVTSYSVCEQFPSRSAAEWTGESEAWYDLSSEERWRLAMEKLRAKESGGCWLEMKPENWDSYHYGAGVTLMDLIDGEKPAGESK